MLDGAKSMKFRGNVWIRRISNKSHVGCEFKYITYHVYYKEEGRDIFTYHRSRLGDAIIILIIGRLMTGFSAFVMFIFISHSDIQADDNCAT